MKKNKHLNLIFDERIFILLLLIFFVATIIFSILKSTGIYGGADNIVHYYIARYAFQKHEFFFDHWGKPLYTELSSPFAQFGLWGLHFFNIIIILFTSWISYKICVKLKIKNAALIVPIILFTPIYFLIAQTVLTEILFSFILVIAVYLFVREKYIFSALIVSFLPFVRSEAIVIFPLFFIGYMLVRSIKSIPFLLSGTIFYSIVGGLFYGDFLWVINRFPYRGAAAIYHHGEILHFVKQYDMILGLPISLLLILGIVALAYYLIRKKPFINRELSNYFVILGSAFIYFLAHSMAWWLGKGGSLGLIRVLAGVTPLLAIGALLGIDLILKKIKNSYLHYTILFLLLGWIIIYPFKKYGWPYTDQTYKLLKKSTEWFNKSDYYGNRVFFYNPFVPELIKYNPFNAQTSGWMIHFGGASLDKLKENDILIWDSHFGPNEGQTELSKLMNNNRFNLIADFYPQTEFEVLGGHEYCIYYFQVVNPVSTKQKTSNSITLTCDANCLNITNNIENPLQSDSFQVLKSQEFINAFQIPINQYNDKDIIGVIGKISYNKLSPGNDKETYLVLDISDSSDRKYLSKELNLGSSSPDQLETTIEYYFNGDRFKDGGLKLYIWNKARNALSVKEVSLEILFNE